MVVFLLVLIVVLALLGAVHWYVWRRLVRDVTTRGSLPRRLGTVAVVVLPLLSFAALGSARAGAPSCSSRRSPGRASSGSPCSCT